MFELNRIEVDRFKIEASVTFAELEENKNNIEKYLIKMETIFEKFPKIFLPSTKLKLFLNGVNLRNFPNFSDGTYNIYCNSNYIGLGIIKDGLLKRDVIVWNNKNKKRKKLKYF